jgi:general secretion pathway protein G
MNALKIQRPALARPFRAGFTLIELLLVLVILAILAGVVVNKFGGIQERARDSRAKTDLANIKNALEQFKIVNGEYPTSEEGLQALVTKPAGDLPDWKPCLDKLPVDPWNHPYIYRQPGSNQKDFDLLSAGPDGREGTPDDIGD